MDGVILSTLDTLGNERVMVFTHVLTGKHMSWVDGVKYEWEPGDIALDKQHCAARNDILQQADFGNVGFVESCDG